MQRFCPRSYRWNPCRFAFHFQVQTSSHGRSCCTGTSASCESSRRRLLLIPTHPKSFQHRYGGRRWTVLPIPTKFSSQHQGVCLERHHGQQRSFSSCRASLASSRACRLASTRASAAVKPLREVVLPHFDVPPVVHTPGCTSCLRLRRQVRR